MLTSGTSRKRCLQCNRKKIQVIKDSKKLNNVVKKRDKLSRKNEYKGT